MVLISSRQKAENIIDTPITWEILEHDMQKAFGSLARIGEKRTAQVLADGNGFLSYIALVNFDWEGSGRELLPQTAVLKITCADKMEDLSNEVASFKLDNVSEKAASVTDNELTFYKTAKKTMKLPSELRIPQFYCGREFGVDGVQAGYFAIEHFDQVETRHFYHTIQESAVLEIIQQIVAIHSHSYLHPELMQEVGSNNSHRLLFEDFTDTEKISINITEASAAHPELAERLEKLRSQLKHFRNWDHYQSKMDETCKSKLLVHGDLWTGNMLWRKDENGDYRMLVMIDWQIFHLGNPLEDLVRLLTSAISGEDYLKRRDFYLKTYYKWFEANIKGREMPWESYEEFLKQYEHVHVYISTIFAPVFTNFKKVLFKKCPEEEKEAGMRCYGEKLDCMLNEAIKYIEKWNM